MDCVNITLKRLTTLIAQFVLVQVVGGEYQKISCLVPAVNWYVVLIHQCYLWWRVLVASVFN